MTPSSISAINRLPEPERRTTYCRLLPPQILDSFHLNPFLVDKDGNNLFQIEIPPDGNSVELSLYHEYGFEDPVLYGHLTDTVNGQIHILLYVINDPDSPRYRVDRMPDGSPTRFGTQQRNLESELAALNAGLLPGQVRRGLHLLREAQNAFEAFVRSLNHSLYFVEPLYYHNALIFEQYGFAYQRGRRFMEEIDAGFSEAGPLTALLGSSPFRHPEASKSIRLRSWAIHDGILGRPFADVTMYRTINAPISVRTTNDLDW